MTETRAAEQAAHAIHARQVDDAITALITAAQDALIKIGVWADDARQTAEQAQGVGGCDALPEPDPEHDRRLALHGVADGILRQARTLQSGVTR